MTGDEATGGHLFQLRDVGSADVHNLLAARVKGAAGRQAQQRRSQARNALEYAFVLQTWAGAGLSG